MSREEMIARLRSVVDERYGGKISRWSMAHRRTRSHGSAILKGKREPTVSMLAEAGITMTVVRAKRLRLYDELKVKP